MGRFVAISMLLLGLAGGCSTLPEAARPGARAANGDAIVQLNLMTMPVGLNLDGRPGVDGLALKVYANDARNPKPVPIRAGTLEVLAWDGTLFGKTNLPAPFKTWAFDAAELRQFEFTSRIGTGYEFSLAWGTNVPTHQMVTVAGRYTAPDGRQIISRPSSVTVIDK